MQIASGPDAGNDRRRVNLRSKSTESGVDGMRCLRGRRSSQQAAHIENVYPKLGLAFFAPGNSAGRPAGHGAAGQASVFLTRLSEVHAATRAGGADFMGFDCSVHLHHYHRRCGRVLSEFVVGLPGCNGYWSCNCAWRRSVRQKS